MTRCGNATNQRSPSRGTIGFVSQIQESDDPIGDAGCRLSIPQLRNPAFLAAGFEDAVDGRDEGVVRAAHKRIGPAFYGYRPLGVVPHGEASAAPVCDLADAHMPTLDCSRRAL